MHPLAPAVLHAWVEVYASVVTVALVLTGIAAIDALAREKRAIRAAEEAADLAAAAHDREGQLQHDISKALSAAAGRTNRDAKGRSRARPV